MSIFKKMRNILPPKLINLVLVKCDETIQVLEMKELEDFIILKMLILVFNCVIYMYIYNNKKKITMFQVFFFVYVLP